MSASVFLMLFWGLSLQSTSAQSSEHQASASAPLKGIDAYVHKVMKQWQVPGLAIAVVKDGKVVLAKGYGIREVGKPGKVDANTLFPIGSITKTMTAEALGTLVSAHKLSCDAPVAQYVQVEMALPLFWRQLCHIRFGCLCCSQTVFLRIGAAALQTRGETRF